MIRKPGIRTASGFSFAVASIFASAALACGTVPCGGGGGNTTVKPGCGYGDTSAHSGPPGIMAKGGFDKDQPANPGGAKECPQPAGGTGGHATP